MNDFAQQAGEGSKDPLVATALKDFVQQAMDGSRGMSEAECRPDTVQLASAVKDFVHRFMDGVFSSKAGAAGNFELLGEVLEGLMLQAVALRDSLQKAMAGRKDGGSDGGRVDAAVRQWEPSAPKATAASGAGAQGVQLEKELTLKDWSSACFPFL